MRDAAVCAFLGFGVENLRQIAPLALVVVGDVPDAGLAGGLPGLPLEFAGLARLARAGAVIGGEFSRGAGGAGLCSVCARKGAR